ncbi:DUF2806 domain-containing protein [Sphingomonas sp. IC-11]|nr:DUF2806 domain-containing protein [Sphingomonas sp. IC-11]
MSCSSPFDPRFDPVGLCPFFAAYISFLEVASGLIEPCYLDQPTSPCLHSKMTVQEGAPLPVPADTGDPTNPFRVIDELPSPNWRRTLTKAALQLIAGTETTAFYDELKADDAQRRAVVSGALAAAASKQAMVDPDLAERSKGRFLTWLLQKQENLEAVITSAATHAPALPAPGGIADSAGVSDEPSEQANTADERPVEPLDPDWVASFTPLAESATSEDLRDRLGRILAGELASPGTYARSTVRQIVELEKEDLERLQRVMPLILGNTIFRDGEREPDYSELAALADAGLIVDPTMTTSRTWQNAGSGGSMCLLSGEKWGIIFDMKEGQVLSLPVTTLTRTGVAVAQLLGPNNEQEVLRRIAARVAPSSYNKVLMGLSGPGGLQAGYYQILPEPVVVTSPFSVRSSFGPPTLG